MPWPFGLIVCPASGTRGVPALHGKEFLRENVTSASCDPNGKAALNTMAKILTVASEL
jgi:hypothetical protein